MPIPTTGDQVSIERALGSDQAMILRCLREAFEPFESAYTPGAFDDTVLNERTLGERLATMTLFVARTQSGDVVGTIGGAVHGHEGHIRGMAVLPAWHGKGVADRLLLAVEAELAAAGCRDISLDTTAPLERARQFYRRHGYAPTGVVSDFFGMQLFEYKKQLLSP